MKKLLIIPVVLFLSCGKSEEQKEVERLQKQSDSLKVSAEKARMDVIKKQEELIDLLK